MLIAIEGIDGSGKGTQAKLLLNKLKNINKESILLQFPQYSNNFFGKEVGKYLNGDYGSLNSINPKMASLLYGLDRFESKPLLEKALNNNGYVICDRYIASNMAHQATRVSEHLALDLMNWIKYFETQILQLPWPDLTIFLKTSIDNSQRLVTKKEAREYTLKKLDLHEADTDHLKNANRNFELLSKDSNWVAIDCISNTGDLRSIEIIHNEIVSEIFKRIEANGK